jgi:hypothetical protein
MGCETTNIIVTGRLYKIDLQNIRAKIDYTLMSNIITTNYINWQLPLCIFHASFWENLDLKIMHVKKNFN